MYFCQKYREEQPYSFGRSLFKVQSLFRMHLIDLVPTRPVLYPNCTETFGRLPREVEPNY